ncbi:MAG TPA: divalent-cation tolerance protein CutA [Caldithrix abyssi]|uniref:Divalent-cation tolerance protein CutA n=1 Tax=Caldithrix abyssi TaxID=187145 RepID=A0A7V5UEU3_CALAY|nr:divalent-cation tolerance protein CutA [Caldithrix abyssi]
MKSDYQVVLCTVPDREIGKKIATYLIEQKLAACCNIVPGVFSVYRWKGQMEQDNEEMLIIKSMPKVFPRLEKAIRQLHPYDVPEIIAIPVANGANDYLDWMNQNIEGE